MSAANEPQEGEIVGPEGSRGISLGWPTVEAIALPPRTVILLVN